VQIIVILREQEAGVATAEMMRADILCSTISSSRKAWTGYSIVFSSLFRRIVRNPHTEPASYLKMFTSRRTAIRSSAGRHRIFSSISIVLRASVRSDLRPNHSHGKENLIQLAALETNLPGPGLARRTSVAS
jgi:hypothetical protein